MKNTLAYNFYFSERKIFYNMNLIVQKVKTSRKFIFLINSNKSENYKKKIIYFLLN